MKKTYYLLLSMITISFSALSQVTTYPEIKKSNDIASTITKVEVTNMYTIVSVARPGNGMGSWVLLNKQIYIQTGDNSHYNFVKAEGIPIAPAKHNYLKPNDTLFFKIYFQKIPAKDKLIDIIERSDADGYFNFYAVNLERSHTATDVATNRMKMNMWASNMPMTQANNTSAMINTMLPLFSGMMDAQLDFYSQPKKLPEIAKLNKQYFDALVKEGFTDDQALRIITATPLMPKGSFLGK